MLDVVLVVLLDLGQQVEDDRLLSTDDLAPHLAADRNALGGRFVFEVALEGLV